MSKYWEKRLRDNEIRDLRKLGSTVKQLAKTFGVSERTVQRALKKLGGVRR